MTKVEEAYKFTGPNGDVALADLFHGHSQLILYHAMYAPEWETPCKSCSFFIDQLPKHLEHLNSRDAAFVLVSRAPYEKIAAFQKRMGWNQYEWLSSNGSDFNYDFNVTMDEKVKPVEYNFRSKEDMVAKGMEYATRGEQQGMSVFMKDGEEIYRSYSMYGRALDHLLTTYGLLDLTPKGRQDKQMGNGVGLGFKYHDEY